jgi:hypothetical protein
MSANKTAKPCTLREWVNQQAERQAADAVYVLQLEDLVNQVANCGVPELALGRLNVLRGNDEFNRLVEVVDRALKLLAAGGTGRDDLNQVLIKNVQLGVLLLMLELNSGKAVFDSFGTEMWGFAPEEASK